MMLKYPVLHSGFVAKNNTALSVTEQFSNPFVENILFRKHGKQEFARLFYSPEVTELYKRYQANTNLLTDIDERERVLKLATIHFGKNGLHEWLEIQTKFAKISYSHLEFLLDNLNFIVSGRRQTSLGMWENLILKDDRSPLVELEKSEGLRVALKDARKSIEGFLSNTLHNWVSHTGGYQDLLYTLYLIFGDRQYPHHTTVQKTGY